MNLATAQAWWVGVLPQRDGKNGAAAERLPRRAWCPGCGAIWTARYAPKLPPFHLFERRKPYRRDGSRQTRFGDGVAHTRRVMLPVDHPAMVEGRPLFPTRVIEAPAPSPSSGLLVFKSGLHSRKLGQRVAKGRLRGVALYGLSLPERTTCPRSCEQYASCYANLMHLAPRFAPGPALERAIGHDVDLLCRGGGRALIRVHTIGDFYSPGYVSLWDSLLADYPGLRIFGYTAWSPASEIGDAVGRMVRRRRWARAAIRWSNRPGRRGTVTVAPDAERARGAIVCPAQTGRTECCASCALCWGTERAVAFRQH